MAAKRKPSPRRGARAGVLRNLYRRWRSRSNALSNALWAETLYSCAYARALPPDDRAQLRELTAQVLRAKAFEGAAGFKVTEPARARIALHAVIPILHLGLDYYADWSSIVIYPGDFRVQDEYMDEHGIVHREIMDLCGQSMSQGPIVLSWEAMRAENETPGDYDLVIHECAHKLDLLNGEANGFPPLHADMDARAWARDFHAAYRKLCTEVDDNAEHSRIDPYAAEDPAEFFAVMSETFFTNPHLVYEAYPSVYKQLQHFYRQDPRQFMKQA
ncbi:membrane protein [Sulfuricaulis limicola]|uniref:Membrane protein n=1 Tax=Sulfuricaulis limicola TaxID=1620215 RepID=A0A1B4XHA2_9GAMM|nr:M90 family metallopeptidase [Sulfuricaulis limicola]BAV34173.1 membrane protein [Sulfuricaulis limicola]